MSQQSDLIKHSDLLAQVVLERRSMQELGQVEVLWTYPQMHRVLGLICKSGWMGSKKTAFNLDQIDTIGSNGVLVNSKPVETDAEKVKRIESLVGCDVWTDQGEKAGKIIDYLFDLETGEIEQYLYISDGLRSMIGSVYLLPANYILNFGNRRVLVPAMSVEAFAVYREGISEKFSEKFSQVTDVLKEEKTQLTQEVRSLFGQAKQRAKEVAEQAKDKARTVAEQVDSWIDELEEVEEPPRSPRSDDPAPWDDWEPTPPKARSTQPTQNPPLQKPTPTQAPKPTPKSSDDPWDDDDAWV